jgi:hypothetical protein
MLKLILLQDAQSDQSESQDRSRAKRYFTRHLSETSSGHYLLVGKYPVLILHGTPLKTGYISVTDGDV